MKSLKYLIIPFLFICFQVFGQDFKDIDKLLSEHKYKDVKYKIEKFLKNDANNHRAHFYLGQTLFFMKEYSDAIEQFEEAIDIDSKNADYHYWKAQALSANAKESNIISQALLAPKIKNEFEQTLTIDPTHILGRIGLINFYLYAPSIMGGGIDKAYTQAVILKSYDEKWGRYLLAQINQKEGKNNLAEEEYKILENKFGNLKDFYVFYNNYGYMLLSLNRKEEAIQKFKKQIELAPNDANAHDSMADAYVSIGDKSSAIAEYKKALSIDPKLKSSTRKLEKLVK